MRSRAPIFGVLAALLLAVGFWFLLYQPASEKQAGFEAQRDQLVAQQHQLRLEIARLEEIRDNQVEIAAQLARLEEYVPSGPAQPAFIRALQVAADSSGVEILSVTFGQPVAIDSAPPTGEDSTALARVPVTVVVDGGYFQAVDLFRRVETEIQRAVLVTTVSFTESGDGFPALSTTWAGDLFTVVPVVPGATPAPAPDGEAPPDDGEPATEPTDTTTASAE